MAGEEQGQIARGAMGTNQLIRRVALVVLGAMLASASWTTAAGAAGSPPVETPANTTSFGFTVRPYAEAGSQPRDSLDYELAAGQTIADRVEVINGTSKTLSFYFYPADAYNAGGGGFALRLRTDQRVDAASWITLANEQYRIPPRTGAIVPLKITVPADAEPGDHTAGIVAEEIIPRGTLSHGAGLQTIERVATRVYIRVAGPIAPAMQVRRITVQHKAVIAPYLRGRNTANVTFTVANTGNVRLALERMRVEIAGPLGLLASTVSIVNQSGRLAELPGELLPGNAVTFRARFKSIPPLGLMSAKVSVDARDPVLNKPLSVSGSTWFWLVPWLLLAVVVVVAVAAVLLWRRRRGRAGQVGAAPPGKGPSGSSAARPGGDESDLVTAGTSVAGSGEAGAPVVGEGRAEG